MKKAWLLFLVVVSLGIGTATSEAQAVAGRADPNKPQVEVSYYKVPPGKQDEWLALYRKYHYPIMKAQLEKGQVLSEQLFTRKLHQVSPDWDFMIIIVTPSPAQAKKDTETRGQLIRRLFPDVDDYVKGETARWALTVAHWDDDLLELDPTKEMSLYKPL